MPVTTYISNCVIRQFLLGERAWVYKAMYSVQWVVLLVSVSDFFPHAKGISSLHVEKQSGYETNFA